MIHSRWALIIVFSLMITIGLLKIIAGIEHREFHDTYGSEDVLVGCILLFLVFLAW